jgi:hypothetical protein
MTATTDIDELAAALDESEAKPLADLQRVIEHIGVDRARQLVDRAREVDAEGGMLTCDESRRRTLGGVFFQLAREHIPRIPPPPRKRRLRWPEAAEVAAEAAAAMADSNEREESSVKITLIGRPGRTITRGAVVVTMMYNKSRPTLPKQLPKLSGADVETPYTVFIAAKQWRKVEEALRDKDDALIIEGYPFLDPDVKGICVFAKSTTTKLLQRARREEQRGKTGSR